ncbi:LysM peptidoglycan-binding domain-containing protein [Kineococcus xinjiangensis]|uniref:LysM peptidoglycan-binding domain-containing protein n=1 Tax=Kineococcus xinjiangensis TaxID=512762 RepID=UPI0011B01950|nr:LysM peptidoglycan-binding domain-containing protein [Kineococcus xinjiangensis]
MPAALEVLLVSAIALPRPGVALSLPISLPQPRPRPAGVRTERPVVARSTDVTGHRVPQARGAARTIPRRARPAAAQAVRPLDQRVTRAAAAPLRITRRGRLVLTCGAAALLASVAAGTALLVTSPASASPAARPATVVTVMPGDTLSAIASQWRPGEDWRDVAAEIRRTNRLGSSQLSAGQRLVLPEAD